MIIADMHVIFDKAFILFTIKTFIAFERNRILVPALQVFQIKVLVLQCVR